nr:hypothetical protein [Tanacetum cinerariifolium]
MMSEDSSAASTDNRPPMLEESDYESWKIRIEWYIKGKTHGKLIGNPSSMDLQHILRSLIQYLQVVQLVSQGLPRRIFNTLNQTQSAKEIWESLELLMKGSDSYIDLYTHLRSYEEHALKKLKKQEQSSSVVDPLAYLVKTTHQQAPTHSTTTSPSQRTPALASTSSSTAQSHDDAIDELQVILGIRDIEAIRTAGRVLTTKRRLSAITAVEKDMLPDKAMLLQAKENGAVLDAEVNHEDAYDSDVDDEPNAVAAFMANLLSSSSQINKVRTFNDNIFETVSPSWPSEVPQDEHLDSDDDSVHEDFTIPYDQYIATKESQDVPTEASLIPPT